MAETALVRIKPVNPRKGFVLRTYVFADILFSVDRGWYEVPMSIADHLRTVHSRVGDPLSPLAFDVCSKGEATALVERERRAEQSPAEPTEPVRVQPPSELVLGDELPAHSPPGAPRRRK